MCQGLFLNKEHPMSLKELKNRLQHRCFPMNIAKVLKTTI